MQCLQGVAPPRDDDPFNAAEERSAAAVVAAWGCSLQVGPGRSLVR